METHMALGTLLVTVAGIFSGLFALPFKHNKKWSWENNWLLWSVMALIIMPWTISFLTVPGLLDIYQHEKTVVLLVGILGMFWGVGAILWGLGIEYLGLGLSVPIMSGLNNSVGTLMPIIIRNPSELLLPDGLRIMTGVAVLLFGIVICSRAGSLKDKALTDRKGDLKSGKPKFLTGLIVCILAGIIGPMINFGFVYGEPLKTKAIEFGSTLNFSSNAIWSIVLTGGFVANFLYCLYLLRKNRSDLKFKGTTYGYWLMALLAGILWYLSIMFYGMGGSNLGKTGASTGWAIMQSLAIIAANVAGILTGEWKGASRKHYSIMFIGMSFLIVGIIIIAF